MAYTGNLNTSNPGKPVDPALLEDLGKTAARKSSSDGMTLAEAIVETIKDAGLNDEQIRRVVEFANVEAFNNKFASLTGTMRAVMIEGGPADPVQVIQAVRDRATQLTPVETRDYDLQPDFGVKTSSPVVHQKFATKKAVELQVEELFSALKNQLEDMQSGAGYSKIAMADALTALQEYVGSAIRQGATGEEIYAAWTSIDPDLAKTASEKVGITFSSVKTAELRKLNPEHPVVAKFAEFAKEAHSYNNKLIAEQEIRHELQKIARWVDQNGLFDEPMRAFIRKIAGVAGDLASATGSLIRGAFRVSGDIGGGLARGLGAPESAGRLLGYGATAASGYYGGKKIKRKYDEWRIRRQYGMI